MYQYDEKVIATTTEGALVSLANLPSTFSKPSRDGRAKSMLSCHFPNSGMAVFFPQPTNDIRRVAGSTAASLSLGFHAKHDLAFQIIRRHVTVAAHPEGMVQQAGGHAVLSCLKRTDKTSDRNSMSLCFSSPLKAAHAIAG
jgi:hypothetical protein